MTEARLSSGIPGFDEVCNGGLLAGRSYLVVGVPGAGKSILSLQWLLEGQRRGERSLYISLTEPGTNVESNVAGFGWQLSGIDLLDLTPRDEPTDENNGDYQIFPPSEVEQVGVWRAIYEAVRAKQPQRLVIDSLTQLHYVSTDEYQFRKKMLELVGFLNRRGCTTLLTFESSELERETAVGQAVDGIIRMELELSPSRLIGMRSLQVAKYRGSDFLTGAHAMRFTPQGLRVFPHRIEPSRVAGFDGRILSSGNAALDALLGGGLEAGTATIISGPTGVGKTTIGVEFLRAAIAAGERAALFSFEESAESILFRSRAIGLPLDEQVSNGSLALVHLNPMEIYPDEFLAQVQAAVEQADRRVIMVDSLRGYQIEMNESRNPLAHIHNLVNYLGAHQASAFLINETEAITGNVMATETGVSHLADNILLVRYAEYQSQIIKVVACLKKRLGDFQLELRELRISRAGIVVGAKLENMHHILTGVPEY